MHKFRYLLVVITLIYGCGQTHDNAQLEEGTTASDSYHNEILGWEINIPKGWTTISRDEVVSMDEKGKEIVEKSTGEQLNVDNLHHVLHLQKDKDNNFASVYEPFSEEIRGTWQATNEMLKSDLMQTYTSMNLVPTVSHTTQEKIGGITFEVYDITVEGPDQRKLLNQTIYRSLVRGQLFTLSFSYKNEDSKNEMLQAFRESTFRK